MDQAIKIMEFQNKDQLETVIVILGDVQDEDFD